MVEGKHRNTYQLLKQALALQIVDLFRGFTNT